MIMFFTNQTHYSLVNVLIVEKNFLMLQKHFRKYHKDLGKSKEQFLADQLERIKKDKLKDEYCEKNHIKLLKIWEHDIKKNLQNVLKIINENVKL